MMVEAFQAWQSLGLHHLSHIYTTSTVVGSSTTGLFFFFNVICRRRQQGGSRFDAVNFFVRDKPSGNWEAWGFYKWKLSVASQLHLEIRSTWEAFIDCFAASEWARVVTGLTADEAGLLVGHLLPVSGKIFGQIRSTSKCFQLQPYDWGEPAVSSYQWTGWAWEITGRSSSRPQENYRPY